MIEYIKGVIDALSPTAVIVECNGLGYEINITLQDYDRLIGVKEAKLYVHELIREDSHTLFGFTEFRERALFRLLIGVSGVGPAAGRLILSSYSAEALENAIAFGDTAALKAVKGIGAKTAERIIIDLKDKINSASSPLLEGVAVSVGIDAKSAFDDALAALVTLGFPAPAARKALDKVFKAHSDANTEQAIKFALANL